MKSVLSLIIPTTLVFLLSCQTVENQLEISSSEELHLAVDSLLVNYVSPDEPGAAILIIYDGDMLLGKGYGLSNYSGQVPIKETTNFRMGSVSKQFTALCILKLVDLKLLYLSQDVGQILDAKPLQGIQIRHLLHHTSGIPDYDDLFNNWNTAEIPQNEDVLNWYRQNGTPLFEPGSQFSYSNGGYNLLASIVEEITGVQFERFATRQVFFSNGMLTSLYYNIANPVSITNRAYCYEKKEGEWGQVDGNMLNGLIGEGGVYTSVRDYFQFDRQLRMGRVLDGDAINQIFNVGEVEIDDYSDKFDFLEPGTAGYAAGWFVQGDKAFHGGSWYGTSTMVVHDLSRPFTIAVFRNTNEPIDELINGLYKIANSYVIYLEKEGSYGN